MLEHLSRYPLALVCAAGALFLASKLALFNAFDARRHGTTREERGREAAWGLTSVALRYAAWAAAALAAVSLAINLLRMARRP